jgi:transposase
MAFSRSDDASNRACMGMLLISVVASVREVADAFGVSHGLVHKLASRIRDVGLDGAYAERRGPQDPSKLTPEVRKAALKMIKEGKSTRAVAAEIGERLGITVSHNTIAVLGRKKGLPCTEPAKRPGQFPLPMDGASPVVVPADLDGVETSYGGAFL